MTCKRCTERGQTWIGSQPKCAFESGAFSVDNWNCATINELRMLADAADHRVYSEDQSSALLPTKWGTFLLLGWYKNRGSTEFGGYLRERKMLPLTEELANAVLLGAEEEPEFCKEVVAS